MLWAVARRKGDVIRTAAQTLGGRGGKARAKALSPEQRRDIARKAAEARWKRERAADR